MDRLLSLIGATAGGWIGYAIGASLSVVFGLFLGVIGTGAGVYLAGRLTSY